MNQSLNLWYRKARTVYAAPAFLGFIIILGLVIRLRDFINNRSIWLDETKIATNILIRSFAGLLQPLDFEQGGPMGWLFAMKAATLALGPSEFALRLIPLLSGCGALVLFPFAARKFLPRLAVPLAVIFFSFSMSMLYFTVEAKQYITDVFFAVLLLVVLPELALPSLADRPAWRRYLPLTLLGILAIPCSHPSIFILAGICLTWGLLDLKNRSARALMFHVGIGALWGVVILLNYFLFLKELGDSDHLRNFWAEEFMPPPWRVSESIPWIQARIFEMFDAKPLDFNRAAAVGIILWGIGAVAVFRRQPTQCVLLVSPLFFVLFAAALHQYPFDSRLILFLAPTLLIMMTVGISALWERFPGKPRCIVFLLTLFLLAPHLRVAAKTLVEGRKKEELRAVLLRLDRDIQPGDAIFLGPSVAITWRYYTQLYPIFNFEGHRLIEFMGDDDTIDTTLYRENKEIPVPRRVWFLFVHYDDDDLEKMLERLEKVGDRVPETDLSRKSASSYLFEIDPDKLENAP